MTTRQKWIVALGLVALALASVVPPFRYVGTAMEVDGGRPRFVTVTGTIHRGAWMPAPKSIWVRPDTGGPSVDLIMVDSMRLDAGRLGLWWAGIALVTIAAVAIAAPRREA